jgi:hypothetical protein
MLVYRTGELGVRAGVRNVTPPGVAVGTVLGLGRLPDSLSTAFYVQGTATKIFDAVQGGTLSTASGALTGTPSVTVHMDDAGHTVYIASSANGYSLAGTTVTSLNNMPAADAIALYGDRLAVVPSSAQNTVQFSAAASFNNWTISAGNAVSITVGDSDPITALLAQRSHLVIFKKTSGIYILSGTPGTNESLRLVSRGTAGPTVSRNAGRTRADDKVWYAATNQQQLSNFDGTNYAMQDNIPVSLYTELAQRVVAPLRLDDQTGAAFLVKANAGRGRGKRDLAEGPRHLDPPHVRRDAGRAGGVGRRRLPPGRRHDRRPPPLRLDAGAHRRWRRRGHPELLLVGPVPRPPRTGGRRHLARPPSAPATTAQCR